MAELNNIDGGVADLVLVVIGKKIDSIWWWRWQGRCILVIISAFCLAILLTTLLTLTAAALIVT